MMTVMAFDEEQWMEMEMMTTVATGGYGTLISLNTCDQPVPARRFTLLTDIFITNFLAQYIIIHTTDSTGYNKFMTNTMTFTCK